jgi:hypothetical protein
MAETITTGKVCREYYYRNNIKAPGLTKAIVVLDGRVLRPSRTRRSRTGAHGEDYYCLSQGEWNRAWVIILEQTNSGKRYVSTINVPESVKELIERAWIYEGATVSEVASVAAKLQLALRQN